MSCRKEDTAAPDIDEVSHADPASKPDTAAPGIDEVSQGDPASKPGGKSKGKGKGPPPPGKAPPPPSSLQIKGPKAVFSGPKLKPLFWTTVTNVNKETWWALGCEGPGAVKFDEKLVESFFGVSETSTATASSTLRRSLPGESGNDKKRRKVVRILDDRTSQQLAIALCRLPPPDRFAAMVNSFDGFPWDFGPTAAAVNSLRTAYEKNWEAIDQMRQQLEQEESDSSTLDLPERFLWELDQVPNVSAKLACGSLLLASSDLPEWRSGLAKVGICCQQLRGSKSLSRCLSTCLAVGNFLNRGTARAEARAVILPESLMKFAEIRGSTTSADQSEHGVCLLNVVTRALLEEEASRGEIGRFAKSVESLLRHTKAAASVGLSEIFTTVPQKTKEIKEIERRLADIEDAGPGAKRVETKIRQIAKEAELAEKLADGARQEWEVTQKWACSRTKMATETWFALWAQFLEKLRQSVQEEMARKNGLSTTLMTSKSCPNLGTGATRSGFSVTPETLKTTVPAATAAPDGERTQSQASASLANKASGPLADLAGILKGGLLRKGGG